MVMCPRGTEKGPTQNGEWLNSITERAKGKYKLGECGRDTVNENWSYGIIKSFDTSRVGKNRRENRWGAENNETGMIHACRENLVRGLRPAPVQANPERTKTYMSKVRGTGSGKVFGRSWNYPKTIKSFDTSRVGIQNGKVNWNADFWKTFETGNSAGDKMGCLLKPVPVLHERYRERFCWWTRYGRKGIGLGYKSKSKMKSVKKKRGINRLWRVSFEERSRNRGMGGRTKKLNIRRKHSPVTQWHRNYTPINTTRITKVDTSKGTHSMEWEVRLGKRKQETWTKRAQSYSNTGIGRELHPTKHTRDWEEKLNKGEWKGRIIGTQSHKTMRVNEERRLVEIRSEQQRNQLMKTDVREYREQRKMVPEKGTKQNMNKRKTGYGKKKETIKTITNSLRLNDKEMKEKRPSKVDPSLPMVEMGQVKGPRKKLYFCNNEPP